MNNVSDGAIAITVSLWAAVAAAAAPGEEKSRRLSEAVEVAAELLEFVSTLSMRSTVAAAALFF